MDICFCINTNNNYINVCTLIIDYDDISDLESEEGTLPLPRRRATSLPNSAGLSVAFEPGTAGLPPPDETTGGKVSEGAGRVTMGTDGIPYEISRP